MSHRDATRQPAWADRLAQHNAERQLQLGLNQELPSTATLPSWEGLPAAQRAGVVSMLARLLAKAGLIRVPDPGEAGSRPLSVEQRSA